MKTLYEELLQRPDLESFIRDSMKESQIYNISNVSAYMSEHRILYNEVLEKFPVFTPPHPIVWAEFTDGDNPSYNIGYLCVRQDIDQVRAKLPPEIVFTDARWHVSFFMFHRKRDIKENTLVLFEGKGIEVYYMLLNKDGTLTEQNGRKVVFGGFSSGFEKILEEAGNPLPENQVSSDLEYLATVLFGFCLTHCKNTVIEEVEPFTGEKKKRNRHGRPGVKYKVLKIKPMGATHKGVGQYTGGSTPSMHIRRGHFKTFTEDAPLFGKWTGLYWWESAVVAKKSKTKTTKDYAVLPPQETKEQP